MLKRILCVLLASMTLLTTLASCGDSEEPAETGAATGSQSTTGDEAETREPLEVPSTRYDGKELVFLTRGDEAEWNTLEIYSAGITSNSDNINNAVYERNLRIYETYGVTVKEIPAAKDQHVTRVTNEISGQNGDFQAIVSNINNSAALVSQGALWDLKADAVAYIDLSKSWWDQRLVDNMSINDRLYFASGDLLTADNDATFAILFNKQIAADNDLPDLYELVKTKEWTMDKLYEFAAKSVKDNDGLDGLAYDADVAGFAYTSANPYVMLMAGNAHVVVKDENDYPHYGLDVARTQEISEVGKRIFNAGHTICIDDAVSQGGSTFAMVGKTCFGENHALFLGECMQCVTRMRGYSVDFGILPCPMYDKAQGEYYNMVHMTGSVVSIPRSVVGEGLSMVTAMIEAMAYHSVDTLTPQYYDINLKSKGVKDEKSAPMIDLILETRAYDLAYYYNWGKNAFGQIADTLLPTAKKGVSSVNKAVSSAVKNDIEDLVEKLDEIAEKME